MIARLLRILLALGSVALVVGVALWGLAHNEAASQRIVPMIPGVKVLGLQGALLRDFKALQVEIALPRGGHITLQDVAWSGLSVQPHLGTTWHLGVSVVSLKAHRLDVVWVPNPLSKALSAPADLILPLSVEVQRLQVDEAYGPWWGDAPLRALDASLALQRTQQPMPVHSVKLAHLAWHDWAVHGDAEIGVRSGLPLQARLSGQGEFKEDGKPTVQGQADVAVKGKLTQFLLMTQARWQRPDAATQSLQLEADVAPFSAWPLARMQVHVDGLNLAALHQTLPRTALQGDVSLAPGADQSVVLKAALLNAQAGAWDAQALPLLALQGQVLLPGVRAMADVSTAWHAMVLDLSARLPSSPKHADATLHVKGSWAAGQSLQAEWRGLEPQALDGRAPPLQLQGTLLIRPEWPPQGQVLSQMRAGIQLAAQGRYGPAFGKVLARGPALPEGEMPVSVGLSGHYAPGRLDITAMSLAAREAHASLKDTVLQWGGQPAWQAKGLVALTAFDPKVWVPWPAAVTGRNALSGEAEVALDAGWHGLIKARLEPSWLGAVPIKGQAQWHSPTDKPRMSVALNLDAGGNTLEGQGDLPWYQDKAGGLRWRPDAQWQARLHAPALQSLQPLAPLLGARQITGQIEGQAQAQGVWPAMTTKGQIAISQLQWVSSDGLPIGLASAKADWSLDAHSPDAPLHVQLDLSQGEARFVQLAQAHWSVDGSARAHHASLSIDVSHKPKANANAKTNAKALPFHLDMAAHGAWLPQSASWQGQVSELTLRMLGSQPRTLLQTQPVDIRWHHDDAGRSLQLSETHLSLLGAPLHLQHLSWQKASASADAWGELSLMAQIDPINLPTLLASWQPQAGWGGDLILGGQLNVRHSQHQPWAVDGAIARISGDITLSEPTIEGSMAQRLGISAAYLALQARDGVWRLSENFEGRILGKLTGEQVVRTRAPDQLPDAADPLTGQLDLQVSNLRPWGTWAPAGWRLTGQLQAQAQVAGTLGAPQYRGQVNAQNLGLGQALMGINLTDGQMQMALQGDHINLTQLTARSGSQGGLMSVTGQATLGEHPEAQLSVKADRFALLQRVDRRLLVSGEVQARLGEKDITADGKLKVDEGLFDITRSDAPTIGDDVNVKNRPGQDPDAAADAEAAANATPPLKLNAKLDVDLGHKLRLKGRGLDAFLGGNLRVTTPASKLAVQGVVRVENGTYAAYGQKLVIERGSVGFTGPVENPRLDILAMRKQSPTASASDVKVGVNITGTALDPRVRLYSDPAMSDTETLSWLVLGRGPSGLGGADLGLLQTAATALLQGEGSSPSDNLLGTLGLDELSVRQADGTVRETVVNVGKQVSKFWYVGYERNLAATSGNWQLIYRLAQRFTVRAQAGDDNAVDFIWSWRWGNAPTP
jgi:translocation and assembly module TamB